jgi:hypothetical protein
MAIQRDLQYASVDALNLDPKNPRLGRHNVEQGLSQDQLLALMEQFTLDELAVSFLENGFWPQEALIVVKEKIGRKPDALVVVEGNRRLAALKILSRLSAGLKGPAGWKDQVSDAPKSHIRALLERIPYLLADSRSDVEAYLGFRHVTGIKQWAPAEKAEFIAKMVESGMGYRQVTRKIGSQINAVRQNYIAYRIFLQMEDVQDIEVSSVEEKFSVLYLSLRTSGVRTYLGIDLKAEPEAARTPIPPEKVEHLVKFALWLFGSKEREPLFTDSRLVEKFGKVLESPQAVTYLETAREPKFEAAYRLAGGSESDVAANLEEAAYNLEEALGVVHLVSTSDRVLKAAERVTRDVAQLLRHFPALRPLLTQEE